MIAIAFVVAAMVGLLGTRAVMHFAPRLGLLDAPDGVRKLQSKPIPLGGGLAVFAAMIAGLLAAVSLDTAAADEFAAHARAWWAFLASAAILVVVGLLDDWYELVARYKLLGQMLAAGVLVFGGDLMIRNISLFGHGADVAWLAAPITMFWLIFAINSLNLLDGMDGLLGTVGGVVCLSLAGVALITGQHLAAAAALACAGGLAGFLRYNLPPARIYLGDCGSMLVGLVVGALCVIASLKSHMVATLVPICVLVLPFLDTTAAVIRRKLSGRSMAHADREHLHHVLLKRGYSIRKSLLVVAVAGSLAGLGAVASVYFVNELIGVGVSLGIVAVMLLTGLFGTTELKLMGKTVSTTTKMLAGKVRRSGPIRVESAGEQPSRPASALPPAASP